MRRLTLVLFAAAPVWLAGCDMLGIESASAVAAVREAEGKAIGGACRHAARSVEQCFGMNKRSDKAAMFAGWREMNDYMRENKIESAPAPSEEESGVAAADEDKLALAKAAKLSKDAKPDAAGDSAPKKPVKKGS